MTNFKVQEIPEVDIFDPEDKLTDRSTTGRERPWRAKKMANELLAAAYDQVDPRKAARLRDCAKVLSFRRYSDGKLRLQSMNSCRVRLCPMCSWRRSLKTYYTVQAIMKETLKEGKDYAYLMLTLTVPNCAGEDLSPTIDLMMKSWHRLFRIPDVDKAVKGWYRGMEVTHNTQYGTKNFDTYHPHFHVLIAVNKSYFTSRDYLSQARWTAAWQQALQVDYTPIVDVRRIKGDLFRAVAEVAKYACKESDYIIPDDWDLTVDTVRLLDTALANRRFVAYGKEFRRIKHKLGLEDEETGSLVDVGEPDEIGKEDIYEIVHYFWYSGYRQYYAVEP